MEKVLAVVILTAGGLLFLLLWDVWQVTRSQENWPKSRVGEALDPNSPSETKKDKLERLDELRGQGAIDAEEYEAEKRKIRYG